MVAGQAVPALSATYSGFVNGDTAASLTTTATISTTATAGSPAGTYPITVGGASSSNYQITYVAGTLTITPATVSPTPTPTPSPTSPPAMLERVSIQKVKSGKHKTTSVIVLQFSEALNAGDAQALGAYGLATVAKSKKQKSKPVALAGATYNASTFAVTLTPRKALAAGAAMELTVHAASLLDATGRPLDNGVNATAVLSKGGGMITSAVPLARSSVRVTRAIDLVIEREGAARPSHPVLAMRTSQADQITDQLRMHTIDEVLERGLRSDSRPSAF